MLTCFGFQLKHNWTHGEKSIQIFLPSLERLWGYCSRITEQQTNTKVHIINWEGVLELTKKEKITGPHVQGIKEDMMYNECWSLKQYLFEWIKRPSRLPLSTAMQFSSVSSWAQFHLISNLFTHVKLNYRQISSHSYPITINVAVLLLFSLVQYIMTLYFLKYLMNCWYSTLSSISASKSLLFLPLQLVIPWLTFYFCLGLFKSKLLGQ